jgi:hypothetical protein
MLKSEEEVVADNPFTGQWTYRSLLNDPDLSTDFDNLEFGRGTIVIDDGPPELLKGKIGGPGWSLTLRGSRSYGSPAQVRFQGKGLVGGEEWIYDYIGWLVPVWPASTHALDIAAIVGSVTRTIPHSSGTGGVAPAGVVASFYAVRA